MSEDVAIADSDVKIEDYEQANWPAATFPASGPIAQSALPLQISTISGYDGSFEPQPPTPQSAVTPRSSERVPIPPVSSTQQTSPTGPMSTVRELPPR